MIPPAPIFNQGGGVKGEREKREQRSCVAVFYPGARFKCRSLTILVVARLLGWLGLGTYTLKQQNFHTDSEPRAPQV